jgi:hypothetical protein
VAGLVLVAVVAIGIDLLIHAVAAIFGVVLLVAVLVAVLWALKTIFW